MFLVTSLAEVWIEIQSLSNIARTDYVTSLAEVWIEMWVFFLFFLLAWVTSLAEVWIEIRPSLSWSL